jgi:hypothetical protein
LRDYVVKISNVQDVKRLVSALECDIDSDIDIVVERHICDAKSLLGFLSYDLNKPIVLEIHSDDKDEISRFVNIIKDYIFN